MAYLIWVARRVNLGAAKMDLFMDLFLDLDPLANLGEHGGRCPQGAEAWVGSVRYMCLREELALRPNASCWICLPLSLAAEWVGLVITGRGIFMVLYCGLCAAWVVYLAKVRCNPLRLEMRNGPAYSGQYIHLLVYLVITYALIS